MFESLLPRSQHCLLSASISCGLQGLRHNGLGNLETSGYVRLEQDRLVFIFFKEFYFKNIDFNLFIFISRTLMFYLYVCLCWIL